MASCLGIDEMMGRQTRRPGRGHPRRDKALADEVVAALAEKGIKVTVASDYNVKAWKKMGKRRRKAEANGQAVGMSLSHLLAAKKLVDEVGSIEQAKEAIAALARLA